MSTYTNVLWNERLNSDGFMGFIDRWWIFWNRIGTILSFVALIAIIIIKLIRCSKEQYKFNASTSRLRHQNRRLT